MINFFKAPYTPWEALDHKGQEKRPAEEWREMITSLVHRENFMSLITVIGSCCWQIWRVQVWLGGTNWKEEIPTFAPERVLREEGDERERGGEEER